jgi:hypothetical protein
MERSLSAAQLLREISLDEVTKSGGFETLLSSISTEYPVGMLQAYALQSLKEVLVLFGGDECETIDCLKFMYRDYEADYEAVDLRIRKNLPGRDSRLCYCTDIFDWTF